METSQPAPPPLSFSIDVITRSTASILLLIYGIGFVILGFHDARYGVVQFSPFRARIVLVGFVFAMLVSLAAAAQHYSLAYFQPLEPVVKDSDPQRRRHRETILTAGFIFTAGVISTFLGTFLFHSSPVQKSSEPLWRTFAGIALYLLGATVLVVAAKTFPKKPGFAVFLSLLAFTFVLGALLRPGGSTPTSYLALMLALVGWHTTWIKREGNPIRYALDFRNWYFVLFLLWIYISQIFGALPARWGGGQPTPIQVFQSNPAPWSPSNPMDALLLDETDQGIYVLLPPTGKAFFVPRSNVASVFFGSKDDLAKKQP
jgi:hypothetical protein